MSSCAMFLHMSEFSISTKFDDVSRRLFNLFWVCDVHERLHNILP